MEPVLILSSLAALVSVFAGLMGLRERTRQRQDAEHEATITLEEDGSTKVYPHLKGRRLQAVVRALEGREERPSGRAGAQT